MRVGITPRDAQNLLWRPQIFVCKITRKAIFCRANQVRVSFKINGLRLYGPQHGVLGVECSNHSVPTIFCKGNQPLSGSIPFFVSGLRKTRAIFSSSRRLITTDRRFLVGLGASGWTQKACLTLVLLLGLRSASSQGHHLSAISVSQEVGAVSSGVPRFRTKIAVIV